VSASSPAHLHLAVALDGTGWHPASWREPVARPRDLFTAGYWADLVTEAEAGLLDFVTIEDGLGPQSSHFLDPDERTDQVHGRLDAVLVASRIAPLTRHITPGGLDVFADKVVPILQERGVFRTEYEGTTLRDHLGLAHPDAAAPAERAAS
jgi:alkanesulfonate monooxygenase SsuD/methylene tetrahydromethanopterin reductase-like flavin-dependent oxidoreductase (luciferase family)